MRPFLRNTLIYLGITILVYFVFTSLYLRIPVLKERWNQGIPNWIYSSHFAETIDDFQKFCRDQQGTSINLILGSSTALHGIEPSQLGENWYSLATRGQNPHVSEIILGMAETKCAPLGIEIDTILIDVYPEFCQSWVYDKGDALTHLALTAEISDIAPFSFQIFRNGGLRRIHNAVSFRLGPKNDSPESKSTQKLRGFEAHHDSGWKAFDLPFDGVFDANCIESIEKVSNRNGTTIFINPPVLHPNHLLSLQSHITNTTTLWLDANTNRTFLDSSLFFDDHHLNHRGARAYTKWIKGHIRRN